MTKLVADALFDDPRIQQAKELLSAAVQEHRSKLNGVKPASPELAQSYDELLKEFGANRGGNLFYRYLGSGIGNGALVELADGSVKYDFITGIGVHFMGHSNPKVVETVVEAGIQNTIMNGHLQQNTPSARLVKLLVEQAKKNGAALDHCFLTSSGVMACENGLKLIFQKRHPAHRVLAFSKCFMGRTLAVSQITDKHVYRDGLPKSLRVDYLPFYCESDHQGSIDRTVNMLKDYLKRYPGEYAAICMELIQGEGGYWSGHPEFFEAICSVCKEHGVSVLVDEVQTFGRTTELFAFQHFKMDKYVDIVTIGKNSQVCATLFGESHKPRPGLISQTFTSSGSAIAAGEYIVKTLIEDGFLGEDGKIMKLHKHFAGRLEALSNKHPELISGPFGVGAMVGMTIFKGDFEKSKQFTFKLFENGALSFIAGANPTRVRFLMPVLEVTENDIDNVCELIEKTLLELA